MRVGYIRTAVANSFPLFFVKPLRLLFPLTVGVGHDEDPVAPVRGIDGTSWNNKRPCGVARALQVIKHIVEPHRNVPSNIFSSDPSGPKFFGEAKHLRPEVAVICLASPLPGRREWLAGIAPANKVNWRNPSRFKARSIERTYIFETWNVGPMLPKDCAAEGIDFTRRNCLKTTAFKAEAKATDARE